MPFKGLKYTPGIFIVQLQFESNVTWLSGAPFKASLCPARFCCSRALMPLATPRVALGLGTRLNGTGSVLPSSKQENHSLARANFHSTSASSQTENRKYHGIFKRFVSDREKKGGIYSLVRSWNIREVEQMDHLQYFKLKHFSVFLTHIHCVRWWSPAVFKSDVSLQKVSQ